jgi:hypothetical protein
MKLHDKDAALQQAALTTAQPPTYIGLMRSWLWSIPLLALLALALWFAGDAWLHLAGDAIPLYGYVAIAGGVLISLLVGGGLMALAFYSARHGYDDLGGGDDQPR